MSPLAAATQGTDTLVPIQMVTLGLLILAAHLGGKLFDRCRLSVATGQLLGGVLVGPWALQTIGLLPAGVPYAEAVASFGFFIFIFVSLVAFSIGEELHLGRLRHVGRSTLMISLIQTSLTFVGVTLGLWQLGRLPLIDALIIGAIGVATAPAMTFVILNRLRIEGRLRNILGSVEVLSDVIGIVIFSLLVQLARNHGSDYSAYASWATAKLTLWPVIHSLGLAHVFGAGIFLVLLILIRRQPQGLMSREESPEDEPAGLLSHMLAEHPSPTAHVFLLVVATVSLGAGLAHFFHLPFFATAAFAGFLVANFHSHAIFDSLKIDNLSALLNLSFFALLGSTVRFDTFDKYTGLLVLIYVTTRTLGKVFGAWLGCKIMKEDRKIASCLPYLLLPQAGIAAVESIYAATILGRPMIAAVLLPAIVFFEIAGVLMSDRTLRRWRSWVSGEETAIRAARQRRTPSAAIEHLLAVLSPSNILLTLTTHTKEDTLKALVSHAAHTADQPFDQEEALQLIKEREQLMATGMGHGIAIPHGRLLALDHPIVIFARHKQGIVFGGMDNSPCHLIVLILSGAGTPDAHIRLLGAMAQLLGHEETRQSLLTASSEETFFGIIHSAAQA
ncbi:MAG: PTS transporter subunit EIIA [Planctomycetes bacterium]|nr:PTS transporter subunit EIIA [Planctomycetota bacterium]